MRQAGILAAAGSYALAHHRERLEEDHANARAIADRVAAVHGDLVEPAAVTTNILYVATGVRSATAVAADLAERGVLVGAFGPHLLRLVTHLDVDAAGCRRAAEALVEALAPSADR